MAETAIFGPFKPALRQAGRGSRFIYEKRGLSRELPFRSTCSVARPIAEDHRQDKHAHTEKRSDFTNTHAKTSPPIRSPGKNAAGNRVCIPNLT